MPNMSGLEFLQKLKAEANETRFGFIGSGITAEMRHLANETGAAFFIGKPLAAATLQSALGTILS